MAGPGDNRTGDTPSSDKDAMAPSTEANAPRPAARRAMGAVPAVRGGAIAGAADLLKIASSGPVTVVTPRRPAKA
jgi:hypothetical protein